MNFVAKEKLCLGKVQGIRAGNIQDVYKRQVNGLLHAFYTALLWQL